MDQATCVAFVEQMVGYLHDKEINLFVQLFMPNAELILPNTYCVGQNAIRNAVRGLFETSEDIQILVNRVFVSDNLALVEWRWRDIQKHTRQVNQTDTAIVLEFEGTQIQRWREYHSPVLG